MQILDTKRAFDPNRCRKSLKPRSRPKNIMLKTVLKLLGATAAALSLTAPAKAQPWPQQPVKMVVPFAPGGATDLIARLLAEHFSKRLGQSFLVENRGGASGIVGTQAVQGARPDGYTLLVSGNGPHATNVALFRKLPYDPIKDFAQISLVGQLPLVLNVNPSAPARTLDEFIAWARSQPGRISYGSPGNGSPPHLSMELLAQKHGLSLVHVPYKGSAPAIADLMAGHVPVMFDNLFASIQNIRAGKIRAIAVGSARAMESLPAVPSFAESGMPGFEVATWIVLAAPARTPGSVVNLLAREAEAIFSLPDVRQRLLDQGALPVTLSPQQTEQFVRAEIQKWTDVVERAGVQRLD